MRDMIILFSERMTKNLEQEVFLMAVYAIGQIRKWSMCMCSYLSCGKT